jgi:5-methylcytosine-specific restriction endonuclease McrBC regulatory subunit McrC
MAWVGTNLTFSLTKMISRHKLLVEVMIYLKIQVMCDVTSLRLLNNYIRFERRL